MKLSRFLSLLILSTTLTLSCAARRPDLHPPSVVEDARELAASDRAAAISMLESWLQNSPDPATEPWVLLWAGEQRRLGGDLEQGRYWLEQLADRYPTHPLKDPALLGMAVIDAEKSLSGNTLATLQLLGDRGVPDSLNADRYRILARVAADDNSAPGTVRELVRKSIAYASSDATVELRVHQTLGDLLTESQSEDLTGVVIQSADADVDTLKRAEQALEDGDFSQAITLAEQHLELWPDSEQSQVARYVIAKAEAGDVVHARKVGVLLPMSGKYAPAATRFKQAIALANQRSGDKLQLIYADTAGDPQQTIAEVERLVLEEGCVGLLGPLLKEGVMGAAQAAQDLRVPMIALSQSENPSEAGEYVFRGFLPLSQQVDALLTHAVEERGFTRFAILYPENAYGESARDLFTEAATMRGATVVRRQGYDPSAKVFLSAARALGNKTHGSGGSNQASNPPTIDYDALFIPDSHQRVALVASSLAYEEFPVGSFRPSRSSRALPLLGLNAWNNALLVESGGQYVQGGVFVDAFLPGSSDPAVQSFVSTYSAEYSRPPGVIDAVTYDATRLMIEAVAVSDGTRRSLQDSLTHVRLRDPVGGGAGFGDDREVDRSLYVLTITKSGIRPWEQSPQ